MPSAPSQRALSPPPQPPQLSPTRPPVRYLPTHVHGETIATCLPRPPASLRTAPLRPRRRRWRRRCSPPPEPSPNLALCGVRRRYRRHSRRQRRGPCAGPVSTAPARRQCPPSSALPVTPSFLLPMHGEHFDTYFLCPSCVLRFRCSIQYRALMCCAS